ncbi:MAG: FtsK/SpoIIIE domain-containing protein [Oscillospiraceae bacterium]|nr:FtsK/SpoIIIE domain-containing protein [Oscillospiraceae bacterium]
MTPGTSDPVEAVLTGLFKGIGRFFKTLGYGIKKLNKAKPLIIGLVIFLGVATAAYIYRSLFFEIDAPIYFQWLIYGLFLASPFLYLYALGAHLSKAVGEYYRLFEEIGFIGRDKRYPMLLYKKEEGKKEILAFRSNIPITAWEKSKPQLETAFDAEILKIEPHGSKRKVKLTTISSDFRLPERIDWNDEYIDHKDGVYVIGENALGPIYIDVNRTPHVLAAGETGSGKSVILRCLFWQFIKKYGLPFMLDFKGGVEFGIKYEKFGEVITERKQAIELFELLVKENTARFEKIRALDCKNLKEYNRIVGEDERLTRIGVFCDEIGEMLDKQGSSGAEKEQIQKLSGYLSTLARLSRATGINLFLGVQRPDANVITGQIKNNVPVRICGRFADKSASEIVLGNTDACRLPEIKGRFLFKAGADTVEFQAYLFDDSAIDGIDANEFAENHRVITPELSQRLVNAPKPLPMKSVPKDAHAVKLDFDYGKRAVNK